MATKKYDLAVKVGEYQSNGETKSRYENVGAVLSGDNGPYIVLKRTFNPAAIGEGESCFISCFAPKHRENSGATPQANPQTPRPQAPQYQKKDPPEMDGFDDDIPF